MTKHLEDLTGDLVPLGLVWEQPGGRALLEEIQRDFHAGRVPAYGRRPGSIESIHIAVPDRYVFGPGHEGTGRYYAEISAERDVDPWLTDPITRERETILADRYEDAAIRRADWEQKLAEHLARADVQEWVNIIYGTAKSATPRTNSVSASSEPVAAVAAEADLSSEQLWAPPIRRGKELDSALDEWCRATFEPDNLPARDELLRLAKTKPEFQNATVEDAKRLRRDFASSESKKGGAGYHRPK